MGEATEKLSGKLGVDTTDFKTNISAANRELRLLESSFRANVSSLGEWSKSSTGMESRIATLTSKIEVQSLKVAALRENFERIKEEQGENSRAAKEAEIALNKETETLGKMETELSTSEEALQELSQAEDEAGNSAEEASDQVSGMSDVIGGIGSVVTGAVAVIAALAVAVAAVTVAIGGLVFSTAEASAELVDLSTKTGISTTQLQELAYIGEQVGTSQETITGSLARLTRSMSGAQDQWQEYTSKQEEAAAKGEEFDGQLGDSAAAFEKLGISVTDSTGQLRDRQDVFNDVINALGGVGNEAERDALAMSIFGKSAMELNPLIKAGTSEMERLAQEAHEVGAVMSEENVAAFEAFDDTLASLQMGLKGTLGTLASAFLPGFQAVFDQLGGYLREFSGIVNASGGDFGALADGLGGLLAKIIGDVGKQAPQMLQAGLGILQSVIDSIVSNLPTLIDAALGIITMLLDFIVANLPMLISAGLEILIALVQGISQALPTLIPAVVQALLTIVQTLIANLPMLIDAALQLILALAEGLVAALPILIPAIPVIVQALVDAFVQALPMITAAAAQLIVTLALGIIQNIPVLLTAAVELIRVLVNYIWNDAPKMLYDAGKNLVTGLWNGIKANMAWLKNNFVNEMKGVVDAIKGALKIKSPSQYMADEVGEFLPLGIGAGFDQSLPAVRQHLVRSMIGLANDVSTAAAPQLGVPGMGGVGSGGSMINIGDIIINIPGTNATPQQISVAVQDGVLKSLRSKGA
jgi:phage-related protein